MHSVAERYTQHQRSSLKDNYTIHKAIRKYGDALVVDTLVEAEDDYCYDLEFKLRPTYGIGYNCAVGGIKPNMTGMKHSDETKMKISARMAGKNHPLYGKPMSVESREKNSASQRGEKSAQYGVPRSDGTLAKCKAWRDSNPHPFKGKCPWDLPRTNKHIWSRAEAVYAYCDSNPSAGHRTTSKYFEGTDAAYCKLYLKIKSGWNPSTDEAFQSWLAQYKLKECNESTRTD